VAQALDGGLLVGGKTQHFAIYVERITETLGKAADGDVRGYVGRKYDSDENTELDMYCMYMYMYMYK